MFPFFLFLAGYSRTGVVRCWRAGKIQINVEYEFRCIRSGGFQTRRGNGK